MAQFFVKEKKVWRVWFIIDLMLKQNYKIIKMVCKIEYILFSYYILLFLVL